MLALAAEIGERRRDEGHVARAAAKSASPDEQHQLYVRNAEAFYRV